MKNFACMKLKIYDGSLWTTLDKMKDWQPPKPLIVVPQRFADWFEEKMAASFVSVVSAYSFSDDEDIKWIRDNGGIDLLCKMKLYGYTVEKEQLYEIRLPLPKGNYASIDFKGYIWGEVIPNKYKLTESEVKNIDERYWAFAVPVQEVQP